MLSMWFVALVSMVAACVCSAWQADTALAQEAPRRVLILYPYDQRRPASMIVGETVTKRFMDSSSPRIDVFSDFLDLTRFEGDKYRTQLAAFLAEKYAETRMDLVVAIGPLVLDFIRENRDQIAPGSRIVYGFVSDPVVASGSDNIVGVHSEYDLRKTLELASRLQPNARRVVVVNGTSKFDQTWETEARKVLVSFAGRYEATYFSKLAYDEMLRAVSRLQTDTIILMLTVARDVTGRTFVPIEVAKNIIKVASVPTYSPYDTVIGLGAVGGYTETFEALGAAVADLAFDLLAGRADTHAVKRNPTLAYRVDARQLQRWGLSEVSLPPETVVLFDKKSVWEEYRNVILAAIGVIALQSLLLTALIVQGARRRRTEAALKESEREAETQRREIAHMSRVLLLGELTGAIAHELNQPLTAILANAEAARMMLSRESPDVEEALAALSEVVEDNSRAGQVLRRLRELLKKDDGRWEPVDLNEIVRSTQALIHSELISRTIRTKMELANDVGQVSGDPVQLQQVTLNLVMNAMDAMDSIEPGKREMIVSTRLVEDGSVEVAVSDNGAGITPSDQPRLFQPFFTTKPHGLGLGLSICSKILISHGGKLSLVAKTEGGALASFILPRAEVLAAMK